MPGDFCQVNGRIEDDEYPASEGAGINILNPGEILQCLFNLAFYAGGAVEAGYLEPGASAPAGVREPDPAVR